MEIKHPHCAGLDVHKDTVMACARLVGDHYFNPQYSAFEPRNTWSLQNAFTSAFKVLDPLPQFRATASLGEFFSLN